MLLLAVSSISSFNVSNNNFSIIVASIISVTITILLLSITFNTKYTIQKELLKYRSGPFFGNINIADIKELKLNTTKYIGLKIALATKGITIKYNKWDEIYISPKEEELFVQELAKINPNIIITHN